MGEDRALREVMFPVWDPVMGYRSPRTVEEWVARRRALKERQREERMLMREFEEDDLMGDMEQVAREVKKEADAWAEEVKKFRKEADAWADGFTETGSSFFEGIGGVVKTLGKVLEDEVEWMRRCTIGNRNKDRKEETASDKKDSAAQTEGDLYSVVQSAFHESERSLSNFFKSVAEGWRDGSLLEPQPASPPKTETTEVVENGITKKTTRKEFVDKHGNTHSKVETTWTDADGRVVMRQVHSSTSRSEHWEKTFGGEKQAKDAAEEQQPKEDKKEGGWFWKK
ncbi:hypothetical protein VTI74DRAFT_3063 [Chaetomium olivicolor]